MNIYPAIDLKSGECVRLYQGCYEQATVYEKNPVALAQSFKEQGATQLHIIDLDGAMQGHSVNLDLILKIKRDVGINIQTGGGIRSYSQIKKLIQHGIDKIILGSIAISNPAQTKMWLSEFGAEKFTLAFDIKMDENKIPLLVSNGWKLTHTQNLWEIIDDYQETNLKNVLCTDIQLDGTLQGPNIYLYEDCVKKFPAIQFQASGGVSTLNHLKKLNKISVGSVIIGKAIYEKKFSLREALTC